MKTSMEKNNMKKIKIVMIFITLFIFSISPCMNSPHHALTQIAQRELCNVKLVVAAENGDLETVKLLVPGPAFINARVESLQVSAIQQASQNGHLDVVRYLWQAKANIDLPDVNGCSPLQQACVVGYPDIVKFLLEKGARAAHLNKINISPLSYASQNGHVEIVALLLDNGAQETIDAKSTDHGTTALRQASQNGWPAAVELLIHAKANLNVQDVGGCTPLFIASQNGHCGIVEQLVAAKADMTLTDKYGSCPLLVPSEIGLSKTVQTLLTAGHAAGIDMKAMINTKSKEGLTPFSQACYGGQVDIVAALIQEKADVNVQDDNGHSPLHVASRFGRLAVVKLLLQHNADIFLMDKGQKKAIDYSANQEIKAALEEEEKKEHAASCAIS
jgi:ankyrin repeat protein